MSEFGWQAFEDGCKAAEKGDFGRAERLFARAIQLGIVLAYVELARMCRDRGDRDGEARWLLALEEKALDGDAEANAACYVAHQFELGPALSAESRQEVMKQYLRMAAELGLPGAQMELAYVYREGKLGELANDEQYRAWIEKAVDQGYEVAICAYVENFIKDGTSMPEGLETKLAEISAHNSRAARALKEARAKAGKLIRFPRLKES